MSIATALGDAISRVGMDWFKAKIFFEHMIGFSHDALHVLVGVCLQLLLAALLKLTLRSPWPWLIILALELMNEAADLHGEVWPDHAMQWGEGAKDVLLTMALPTLLLAIARWRPQLLGSNSDTTLYRTDL